MGSILGRYRDVFFQVLQLFQVIKVFKLHKYIKYLSKIQVKEKKEKIFKKYFSKSTIFLASVIFKWKQEQKTDLNYIEF